MFYYLCSGVFGGFANITVAADGKKKSLLHIQPRHKDI